MRQAEKEKKKNLSRIPFILDPCKKIPKKNIKKIQKIIKPLPVIIFRQNGMREAKNERKKFQSRIPFILDLGKKIPKKIVKNFKKLYNLFPALFSLSKLDEIGRKREKKKIIPNSVHTIPGQENTAKISNKIQKIIKPLPDIIFN